MRCSPSTANGVSRRRLRRVLLRERRPALDPALAVGQGSALAVSRGALRRARDGGGPPAPGLEGGLGLAIDHAGFHPTTRVKFGARLLLHGKERLASSAQPRAGERARPAPRPSRADRRLDPMLAAAATQDTVTLVRSGVAKLAAVLATPTSGPPKSSRPASTSIIESRARSLTATGAERARARRC